MTASPSLEPKRLLPALLRYAAKGAPEACRAHTLRYIDHCLNHLLSEDPAIHQLAVSPSWTLNILHRIAKSKAGKALQNGEQDPQ